MNVDKLKNPIKTFSGWLLSFFILPFLRPLTDFQLSIALMVIFTIFYYLIDGIFLLAELRTKKKVIDDNRFYGM